MARWFENAIKINPSRPVAYLDLGDAQRLTGDTEKAKKAYQAYLELAPEASAAPYVRQQLGKL